ncbi:MAG: HypC/HybG/HupF family hydrogenase formation chaperone [Gaiellales bacterium]
MTCDDRYHCTTCSDEAVAMRVVELRPDSTALCEGGVEVLTDLVDSVDVGERLLVHAGVALAKADA